MTIGERIKFLRTARGLSQEDLGAMVGVKKAAIYKYETGLVVNIKRSMIQKLANALDSTPAYLMGWEEETATTPTYKNIIPMPKMRMVPLVGTIACGTPILADENIMCDVPMPETVRADFALRCKGDSMTGARINDGDLVYIRTQEDVETGEIAAVLLDDEATLKRVYKSDGAIVLQPANPAYDIKIIAGEALDTFRIVGKAVAFTSVI